MKAPYIEMSKTTKQKLASQEPKQVLRAEASVMSYFSFTLGAKVVWLAPATRSRVAKFISSEVKVDGNEYAVIQLIPGVLNEQFGRNERLTVPIDQLLPYELL